MIWHKEYEFEILEAVKLTKEFYSHLSDYVVVILAREKTMWLYWVGVENLLQTSEIKIDILDNSDIKCLNLAINSSGTLLVLTNSLYQYYVIEMELKKGLLKMKKSIDHFGYW